MESSLLSEPNCSPSQLSAEMPELLSVPSCLVHSVDYACFHINMSRKHQLLANISDTGLRKNNWTGPVEETSITALYQQSNRRLLQPRFSGL